MTSKLNWIGPVVRTLAIAIVGGVAAAIIIHLIYTGPTVVTPYQADPWSHGVTDPSGRLKVIADIAFAGQALGNADSIVARPGQDVGIVIGIRNVGSTRLRKGTIVVSAPTSADPLIGHSETYYSTTFTSGDPLGPDIFAKGQNLQDMDPGAVIYIKWRQRIAENPSCDQRNVTVRGVVVAVDVKPTYTSPLKLQILGSCASQGPPVPN